ncbi:VWA domain-containing protein [uncultured Fusobacterium sp.]|uniref:VWA domain-containing protein n=1 Tax=uncultured Fusobacterium sp. TaxID=159267 RepID=UPI0015A5E04C|nr:VWA domain-containing protein [uncultured Fusobacterium sp.]
MFKFNDPYFFILIPFIIYLFFKKEKSKGIKVPSIQGIKKYSLNSKRYLIGKYFILISCILMVIGLARPQRISDKKIKKDGIDIVVVLDLSKSMLQEDFNPNRLEKSKELLSKFISQRVNDRMGLVIFGGDAYTKIPLTFDNSMLREVVEKIKVNDITSNNRTAIGMGVGVAINRLKESESKSKVIILMTDGENNYGELSPIDATKLAKELGIKIYTIGIGAYERNVPSFFGVMRKVKNNELDENLLTKMAEETNGKYFRASDEKSFEEIFSEINKLEKTEIEKQDFVQKEELYMSFVKASLIFLLIGLFFEFLLFIRLP